MGIFDTIHAELECPETKKTLEAEIQIKWRDFSSFRHYRVEDKIDNIKDEYNNTWIKTDYICDICSVKTIGRLGEFIRTEDQKWHDCYIHIENSVIKEVRTEPAEEFIVYE